MNLVSVLQELGISSFKIVGKNIYIDYPLVNTAYTDSPSKFKSTLVVKKKLESIGLLLHFSGSYVNTYLPRNLVSAKGSINWDSTEDYVSSGLHAKTIAVGGDRNKVCLGKSFVDEAFLLKGIVLYDTTLEGSLNSQVVNCSLRDCVLNKFQVVRLFESYVYNTIFNIDKITLRNGGLDNVIINSNNVLIESPYNLNCKIKGADIVELKSSNYNEVGDFDVSLEDTNKVRLSGLLSGDLRFNSVKTLEVTLDSLILGKAKTSLHLKGNVDSLYIIDCKNKTFEDLFSDNGSKLNSLSNLNYNSVKIFPYSAQGW